jgi:uncharacterized membrane protein YecN with MAPEG domain
VLLVKTVCFVLTVGIVLLTSGVRNVFSVIRKEFGCKREGFRGVWGIVCVEYC